VIPGFPRIEALRFEGWLFADWEGTSLGGMPRRIRITSVMVSADGGKTMYPVIAGPDDYWYWDRVPPKRRPAQREMFVAPVATGGHL
jgi:hypothetical protein